MVTKWEPRKDILHRTHFHPTLSVKIQSTLTRRQIIVLSTVIPFVGDFASPENLLANKSQCRKADLLLLQDRKEHYRRCKNLSDRILLEDHWWEPLLDYQLPGWRMVQLLAVTWMEEDQLDGATVPWRWDFLKSQWAQKWGYLLAFGLVTEHKGHSTLDNDQTEDPSEITNLSFNIMSKTFFSYRTYFLTWQFEQISDTFNRDTEFDQCIINCQETKRYPVYSIGGRELAAWRLNVTTIKGASWNRSRKQSRTKCRGSKGRAFPAGPIAPINGILHKFDLKTTKEKRLKHWR